LEGSPLGLSEPLLGYHPSTIGILTVRVTIAGTVLGGQFDWGGRLPKCNGGAQRFPQRGRKPRGECKGRRELDCEPNTASRYESRA
jgi:hypothetical protein